MYENREKDRVNQGDNYAKKPQQGQDKMAQGKPGQQSPKDMNQGQQKQNMSQAQAGQKDFKKEMKDGYIGEKTHNPSTTQQDMNKPPVGGK